MSEVADRRQRALEAFDDRWNVPVDVFAWHHLAGEREGWAERLAAARDEAVRTATRVKITHDVIEAAAVTGRGFGFDMKTALEAAFLAAGFEVVE